MNRLTAKIDQFSFSANELSKILLDRLQNGRVGYWEHQFDRFAGREQALYWNLAIANGQILYTGNRLWSVQSLMRVVHRYARHTRNDLVRARLEELKTQAEQQSLTPAQLLALMKKIGIVNDTQLIEAIKTKILNDLDIYLLTGNGTAKFIPEPDLALQLPIEGFSAKLLLDEAKQRQARWEAIQVRVPSMNLVPFLNRQAIEKSGLPTGQQERIENLVKSQQTLNAISEEMAKDTLEIAEMFAKLASSGLIGLKAPQKSTPAPIMAIDDSPLILTQFQHLVEGLGYQVSVCQQAEIALSQIVEVEPAAIFIDINMPGLSGFELVKQIRKQPQLSAIPLVILTGEQKLSNRWRAQWSGCEFLTKPLESGATDEFQLRIQELLLKLVGTADSLNSHNYSQN